MTTPTLLDQGLTYRCGAFAVRAWFEGYGYRVADTETFYKYVNLADQQNGLSFSDVSTMVTELAHELGCHVTLSPLTQFSDLDTAIKNARCVVVGVWEADIHPDQDYYHFIDIAGEDDNNYDIVDSFHIYDGDSGSDPVTRVQQAIRDNWDFNIIGLEFSMTATAPTGRPTDVSREAVMITRVSVMGDMTYPDGVDMYSQAPGQPKGVTRVVFQRELIQAIKKDYGAA